LFFFGFCNHVLMSAGFRICDFMTSCFVIVGLCVCVCMFVFVALVCVCVCCGFA
jgi:hypothetical protein